MPSSATWGHLEEARDGTAGTLPEYRLPESMQEFQDSLGPLRPAKAVTQGEMPGWAGWMAASLPARVVTQE